MTNRNVLFINRDHPKEAVSPKSVSRAFKIALQKAKEKGTIRDPTGLRLYSLVYFFRDQTRDYQKELEKLGKTNTPRDDETCRSLYEELAMPNLEIESRLPKKLHRINERIKELQSCLPEEERDEYGEYLDTHPEEKRKVRREAEIVDFSKEEFPKELGEQDDKLHMQHLDDKLKEAQIKFVELESRIAEIKRMLKKVMKQEK